MAPPGEVATSFQELVNEDRRKRKHEDLANSMLGSRRNTPAARASRKSGPAASLASRVGINKRSSSASPRLSTNNSWVLDTDGDPSLAPKSKQVRRARNDLRSRLSPHTSNDAALANVSALSQQTAAPQQAAFSIKGKAKTGPFVVVASNFMLGTTADDVYAAVEPHAGNLISCVLVAKNPTVMAEIVCGDRAGAENVIAMFNNQMADGKLLYVFMKDGPPAPAHKLGPSKPAAPQAPAHPRGYPSKPESARQPEQDVDMDMDMEVTPQQPRGDSRQERGGRNNRPGYGGDRRERFENIRSSRDDRSDYRRQDDQSYGRGGGGFRSSQSQGLRGGW